MVQLVMDEPTLDQKGNFMAEEEPLLADPPTQEMAVHVRDYDRFTRIFKWGAITCFIIGLFVLMILR